jgi:FlaA1/EpsC-like NDP-sugar epimerase
MSTAGSIILGIVITLICVGIIVAIVRLIIAFAKFFLVIGIIIAIIFGIVFLGKWAMYIWQTYIWTDIGRTIMIWAVIAIAGLITWRAIRKAYINKHMAEINAKIYDKMLAAGQLNITNRYVYKNGQLIHVEDDQQKEDLLS